MGKRIEEVGCTMLVLAVMVLFAFNCLLAVVLMILWNYVAPVFWSGAPILTFWQTLAAMILLSVVFTFLKNVFKN